MNLGLICTLGVIIFSAVAAACLIGASIYMSAVGGAPAKRTEPAAEKAPATTTTSTATSTTAAPRAQEPPAAAGAAKTATTSRTMKGMTLAYSPARLYKGDDASLDIRSGGERIMGAAVYLDGALAYQGGENYPLFRLDGGTHRVAAVKGGYTNGTIVITVDADTYATSKDVREELKPEERRKAFEDGKADVRFYETSFCSNCDYVRKQLSKVVDKNRRCIVYERLSYYSHANELGNGELPFIEVEGAKGTHRTNGVIPMSKVKEMVFAASGCDIE
jgi:hypothetical protein